MDMRTLVGPARNYFEARIRSGADILSAWRADLRPKIHRVDVGRQHAKRDEPRFIGSYFQSVPSKESIAVVNQRPSPSFCKAGPVTRYMVHSCIGTAPRLL